MASQNPSFPLTVSQLTQSIKQRLESSFPFVHLQGEISNCKEQTSGHFYFSLKDAESQVSAVMFRADALLLKKPPKGGDQVVVKGSLNLYPPKGTYQLVIRELFYVGIGELLQKLEILKIKLHQLGWFKSQRKKKLPPFPRRIGVVTSPTGAVIQDILHVLSRRFSGFHLILYPVKVQGEGAAEEIAQAIQDLNRYHLVDVIIIGRGGGSLEDLWAFNEEKVAAAIYESLIPTISAVGHETDHCIADYVADVRAPTPSAAAEIVTAEKTQLLEKLGVLRKQTEQILRQIIRQQRARLEQMIKHPLMKHPRSILELRMQKLDDFKEQIEEAILRNIHLRKEKLRMKKQHFIALSPSIKIMQYKKTLAERMRALERKMGDLLKESRKQLSHLLELLEAVHPKKVMDKGYSILFSEKGESVINSVKQIEKGQKARLFLSDGELLITIDKINKID